MAVAIAEVTRVVASRSRSPEGIKLGETLERLRRAQLGLTQKKLAEALDMSEEGYRNYVKGYGRITRDTLPKWSTALGIPIPELAEELGIELLTDSDASGLRQQLATLFPDASAAELDIYMRDLATLPASDQRQILDGFRDWIAGRKAHLGLA